MRIGFITGSISRIGSGRTEALPLASALMKLGSEVYGLETSRYRTGVEQVEGLPVHFTPVLPHLAPRSLQFARSLLHEKTASYRRNGRTKHRESLSLYQRAAGSALLGLSDRLNLDVLYAFHNTNVARLGRGWPQSRRILAINLIGFGIDAGRGGMSDTFPLQEMIFERPFWDLHITATRFEYEQYIQVYEQLGIDTTKLLHLPHSYDERLFTPFTKAGETERNSSPKEPKIILYPVNVYPRKNIELAIDVLAELRNTVDCKLIVTGKIWDQDYHAKLIQRARARQVADRVQFLGGVPIEALVQLFRQAAVTIYTSHQETFGHGLVESLGCGTPVVGPSWINPCREILNSAIGGQASPKEPQRFAAAINATLQAELDPEQIAKSARACFGNLTIGARFLEKCQQIKANKDRYTSELSVIDWKGLYQDAGDLL